MASIILEIFMSMIYHEIMIAEIQNLKSCAFVLHVLMLSCFLVNEIAKKTPQHHRNRMKIPNWDEHDQTWMRNVVSLLHHSNERERERNK